MTFKELRIGDVFSFVDVAGYDLFEKESDVVARQMFQGHRKPVRVNVQPDAEVKRSPGIAVHF